ncbi:MAG: hypothetical protein GY795_50285 [Desulfobacterales bacterium]|nr:hypothetical protein [Desulfobacterales bacterium]
MIEQNRNQVEYNFYGLKRSGNHAIMTWIAGNLDQPVVLLNNSLPFTDPYKTFNHDGKWDPGLDCFKVPEKWDDPIRFEQKKYLFISFEDINITGLDEKNIIPDRISAVGSSSSLKIIFILRDPFNFMASRFCKKTKTVSEFRELPDALDAWKMYAFEFLGKTSYITNKTLVNYNTWFKDRNYRIQLAEQLNIPFSDKGINIVTTAGRGSSFDQLSYNGNAQQMNVFERWKNIAAEPDFQKLFKDQDEILELSETIFGEIEGTRSFMEGTR